MLAFNLASLSLLLTPVLGSLINTNLSPANVNVLAVTEDPAVVFTTWTGSRTCDGSNFNSWTNSDGGCFSLPGESFRATKITNTSATETFGLAVDSDETNDEMMGQSLLDGVAGKSNWDDGGGNLDIQQIWLR
ncbi:hypothetical protein QBC43DRAFT_332941 [Cladorrhinum sp. PSN259]|nr:hypothetical protein QBC43DRAFT_332941 [Cladorrhinum sp. PSN259]